MSLAHDVLQGEYSCDGGGGGSVSDGPWRPVEGFAQEDTRRHTADTFITCAREDYSPVTRWKWILMQGLILVVFAVTG